MFDKEMVHESFESNLLAEEVGESTNLHRDRERGREDCELCCSEYESTTLLALKRLQKCI